MISILDAHRKHGHFLPKKKYKTVVQCPTTASTSCRVFLEPASNIFLICLCADLPITVFLIPTWAYGYHVCSKIATKAWFCILIAPEDKTWWKPFLEIYPFTPLCHPRYKLGQLFIGIADIWHLQSCHVIVSISSVSEDKKTVYDVQGLVNNSLIVLTTLKKITNDGYKFVFVAHV